MVKKEKKGYLNIAFMVIFFFIVAAAVISVNSLQVMATGLAEDSGANTTADTKIMKVLEENSDLFDSNDIVSASLRKLGWKIVQGMAYIGSQCAVLFDKAFDLIDFTTWSSVNTYISKFMSVWKALVVVAIFFIGVLLVFNYEKKPKVAINICLAVLVITSSTFLLNRINSMFTDDLRASVIGRDKTTDAVYTLVGDSIYDLKYIENTVGLMKVKQNNRKTLDNLSESDMQLIDINELFKPDDVDDADVKELLSKKIVYTHEQLIVKDISSVLGIDLLSEYYYRYDIDWMGVFIGLTAIIIVYICLAYKVVRILYEIVIHQILAVLYSANLSNGQKTIKILDGVKNSYIVLFLIMVCMKIYLLANKYISNNIEGSFVRPMLKLFIALAVIDGPNIIQQLAGIDAGLSDGIGKILAGVNTMRMARYGFGYSGFRGTGLYDHESNNSKVEYENSRDEMNGLEGNEKQNNKGETPPEKERLRSPRMDTYFPERPYDCENMKERSNTAFRGEQSENGSSETGASGDNRDSSGFPQESVSLYDEQTEETDDSGIVNGDMADRLNGMSSMPEKEVNPGLPEQEVYDLFDNNKSSLDSNDILYNGQLYGREFEAALNRPGRNTLAEAERADRGLFGRTAIERSNETLSSDRKKEIDLSKDNLRI